MSVLGDRLREARQAMGWTLEEAAPRLGVNWNSIRRWEVDEIVPSRSRVMGMAYLYGRPLSWLYDDETEYESPRYADPFSRRLRALAAVLREAALSRGISLDSLFGVDGDSSELFLVAPHFEELDSFPIAAAAGAGAEVLEESRVDHVRLDPGWLRSHALRPDRCDVISVRGVSMEPTLPDGCSILVDRSSTELRDSRIFVLRTADGLVVKRARSEDGRWVLAGDNPDWVPAPLADDDSVVGEVRWSGRIF
jgi:transcriptional regulator with XRE-family HTH domain